MKWPIPWRRVYSRLKLCIPDEHLGNRYEFGMHGAELVDVAVSQRTAMSPLSGFSSAHAVEAAPWIDVTLHIRVPDKSVAVVYAPPKRKRRKK